MRGTTILMVSFLLMSSITLARDQQISYLARGSSVSTQYDTTTILVSPNGAFSCGFYKVATNTFTFSIWFSWSSDKTVAWTANHDAPVNGKGSKITFWEDGRLVLLDYNGTAVWSTNTTATRADRTMLLDTGNLVIMDKEGKHLWRSFDSPTDTLLPLQPITRNSKLVSASAKGLLYSGLYTFCFSDNLLILTYHGPEISSIYWPPHYFKPWEISRVSYNSSQYGVLDQMGQFVASDKFRFKTCDFGDEVMRRLTLDYDGNLRVYSLNATDGCWSISWMAFLQVCEISGVCGINSLCTYIPKLECSCLQGFEMNDPSDWSKGCKRKVNMTLNWKWSKGSRDKVNRTVNREFSFMKLSGIAFVGYDFNFTTSLTFLTCKKICLRMQECQAFDYRKGTGQCYTKVVLYNGRNFTNSDIYLKVPKAPLSSPEMASKLTYACKVTEEEAYPSSQLFEGDTSRFKFGYFLTSALTLFVIEVLIIITGCWVVYKWERRPEITDEGYTIISSQFRRFSYKDLHKATKGFQERLGSGGSGAVYKGVLDDERNVAVKTLKDVVQGDQEFRSELSVIGRIYHMNLVRIWGFCAERSHRMVISEFVRNGSLDRVLFPDHNLSFVLKWSQRYNIALGVAKGLAYLHHECLEWIVHCDIKPENILLDEDFEAKIADFGLVKLLGRGSGAQMLSRVQGTRGYIAPEWALNLPITGKADVYSYGVVLLELVKGTRVSSQVVESEREVDMALGHFSESLKDKLAHQDQSWLVEFVDSRLGGEFDYSQAAIILKLAVSCVEEEWRRRPNMSHVVETLLSLVE